MNPQRRSLWLTDTIDPAVVDRIAAAHAPFHQAVEMAVDIVGDPHAEDDYGRNWTRLRFSRHVADVVPGATVLMGSSIGTYLAKVVEWDFEVSDDDPMVILELLPVSLDAVAGAFARAEPEPEVPSIISRIRFTNGSIELLPGDLIAALSTAQELQRNTDPVPVTRHRSLRLRQLFDFNWKSGVAVVVPILASQEIGRTAVAIEDMYALESYVRAVIQAYPREFVSPGANISVELANDFPVPDLRNLISVCSPKRNALAREVLRHADIRRWLRCDFRGPQEKAGSPHERWGMRFSEFEIESPSYDQERDILGRGGPLSAGPLTDYALLARVTNPWNPLAKIVLAAGIRAFGSWGAAEFLRAQSDDLAMEMRGNDFAVILKVTLENFSISAVVAKHIPALVRNDVGSTAAG